MPRAKRLAVSTFRFFASLKLAVPLLLALSTVLAWATILESGYGAPVARWRVYESGWFLGLLALLAVNIFCAAAIRFPWRRSQTGFVVTHCGLLVLLAGSIQSFLGGVEGQVSLAEGESTDRLTVRRGGQITAFWVGRPDEPAYEFSFDPGPFNWPAGKSASMGEVDGVSARILGYLRHPKAVEEWVADEAGMGGPVLKFRLKDRDGAKVAEGWLVDQQFGDAVAFGPLRIQLQRASADRMLDDFSNPPTHQVGENGLLAIYYEDVVEYASLDSQVGERIPLGTTGVEVELAEYLPNAKPDRMGRFQSKGDQPKNPMVELRVHLPGDSTPLRQIAFAKDALLNLDGIDPRVCPVKFRLHHPAIQPQTAFEFLQTRDGKLFGRLCSAGECESHGEVKPGSKFTLPGKFKLEVLDYLPYALQKVSFVAGDEPANLKERDKDEPAALVELQVAGKSHQVWLRRNDPTFGGRTLTTPGGLLGVKYEYAKVPLGCTVKLLDFRRDANPGGSGAAAFSSRVELADRELTIAMNEPKTFGKFRFYQSGFSESGHDRQRSTFSVAYDPGRGLKYAGSLMICLGIGIMFFMRAYFAKPQGAQTRQITNVSVTVPPTMELKRAA